MPLHVVSYSIVKGNNIHSPCDDPKWYEAYWPVRTSRWEMPWRRANGLEARSPIVRAPLARGTFVREAIVREHQVLVTLCCAMQCTKISEIDTDHSWQVLSRDSKNVSFFSLSIIEMQNLWDLHVLKLRWSWQWWKCNKYVVHSEKKIGTKLIFHEKTKTSPQAPLSLGPPLPGQI